MKRPDEPRPRKPRKRLKTLRGLNPDQRALRRQQVLLVHSGLLPRATKTCEVCGTEFKIKLSHASRVRVCSLACRRANGWTSAPGTGTTSGHKHYIKPRIHKVQTLAKLVKSLENTALTPTRAAQLRGQIASVASDLINQAAANFDIDPVTGEPVAKWTPTQARIFGMLMSKVLPDLNASHVVHERRDKRVEDMTTEELEALVAEALEAQQDAPIEGEIIDADRQLQAPHSEDAPGPIHMHE